MCGSNFQAYVRRPPWMAPTHPDEQDLSSACPNSFEAPHPPSSATQLQVISDIQREEAATEARALFAFLFGGRSQDDGQ